MTLNRVPADQIDLAKCLSFRTEERCCYNRKITVTLLAWVCFRRRDGGRSRRGNIFGHHFRIYAIRQRGLIFLPAFFWKDHSVHAFQAISNNSSRSFERPSSSAKHVRCYVGNSSNSRNSMSTTERLSSDVVAQKKVFRKKIRESIKELSKGDVETQSLKVWEQVFMLPVYQSAKAVGLFLSMPNGEINTDPIIQHAIENGKDVYVPQVGANFEKCDMELLKVVLEFPDPFFHKKWPTNKWQIPEPPAEMPIETARPGDLDLLIVPGLGFDGNGNRLGQGKGYYDRFIARMTENDISLPLVAVGLEAQFVDEDIPVETYDKQMDMVVLPSRIILSEKK